MDAFGGRKRCVGGAAENHRDYAPAAVSGGVLRLNLSPGIAKERPIKRYLHFCAALDTRKRGAVFRIPTSGFDHPARKVDISANKGRDGFVQRASPGFVGFDLFGVARIGSDKVMLNAAVSRGGEGEKGGGRKRDRG